MFGLDARAARAAWTVIFIVLLAGGLYLIRRTLLIFVFALLFAYLLSPLVDLVDRFRAKRFPRNLSLAVVYLLMIAVLATSMAAIGSRIGAEASNLARTLPKYLENPQAIPRLPIPAWLEPYKDAAIETLRVQLESHARDVVPMLAKAGETLLAVFGNLVFVLLVPILSFFFLKDSRDIRGLILEQFADGAPRRLVEDIFTDVHVLLAQFMRALVLLSLVTFTVYWLFLAVIGVPYALLLAVVAGLLDFIPVAGPLAAALVILVVAGFAGYPHLLWIVVFLVAFRLFQDYVAQPYLLGSGVELPPGVVIFGVLAGEQIGGVTGMFLSIPVLATLRVVYVRFRKGRRARS